ncbi:MAG: nuclear transport factor 2 family protein [Dehalococcoidia bacterium]
MTYTPTEQANIQVIRKTIELEAARDWEAVYSLVTPDCVTYMGETVPRGAEEMKAYDARFFPLFTSTARTILDIAADGDAVVFRWRADATLAKDGRAISWEGVSWCLIREGQVAEGRIYVDSAEVQRQLAGK